MKIHKMKEWRRARCVCTIHSLAGLVVCLILETGRDLGPFVLGSHGVMDRLRFRDGGWGSVDGVLGSLVSCSGPCLLGNFRFVGWVFGDTEMVCMGELVL